MRTVIPNVFLLFRFFTTFRKIATGDCFLCHGRISLTLVCEILPFFHCRPSSASFTFVPEETSLTMSLLSSVCVFRQALKDTGWFLFSFLSDKQDVSKIKHVLSSKRHLSIIECSMRHFLAIDPRVSFTVYLSVRSQLYF
jgi:hypothetical protein